MLLTYIYIFPHLRSNSSWKLSYIKDKKGSANVLFRNYNINTLIIKYDESLRWILKGEILNSNQGYD